MQLKSGARHLLAFDGDSQLYEWQEALYARSPLAGISAPTEFVHHVHVGVDALTGEFTVSSLVVVRACLADCVCVCAQGVPEQWKMTLFNVRK